MKVYADNGATTRISRRALSEMTRVMAGHVGNPSGAHFWSMESKMLLENAREKIARCINAKPEEIYFTSGGTESNNMACVIGSRFAPVCYISNIEHHSVKNAAFARFCNCYEIPANEDGCVDEETVYDEIRHETAFVSVMMANNEIGTKQPVKEISHLRGGDYLFHTDAVQAAGHVPIDVKDLGVDMLSASAHKFHGPAGVGFLYVRKGVPIAPLHYGGGQERGMRSGTENVAGVVAMAAALSDEVNNMVSNNLRVCNMRDLLIHELLKIPDSHLNGSRDHRLPGIVNIGFDGIEGSALVTMLSTKGVYCSAGSSCSSGSHTPSRVLMAIGRSDREARSAIRISIDHYNTEEEIEHILHTVPECVTYLRRIRAT